MREVPHHLYGLNRSGSRTSGYSLRHPVCPCTERVTGFWYHGMAKTCDMLFSPRKGVRHRAISIEAYPG
jgi:hypothetical protein